MKWECDADGGGVEVERDGVVRIVLRWEKEKIVERVERGRHRCARIEPRNKSGTREMKTVQARTDKSNWPELRRREEWERERIEERSQEDIGKADGDSRRKITSKPNVWIYCPAPSRTMAFML